MARRQGRIVQRGPQSWQVSVFMGRDPETGKRNYHYRTFKGKGAKKQAQAYMNKTLREKDLGTFVEPARISLDKYLDQWLETAAKPRLRSVTFDSYVRLLRLYIRPDIGNRSLAAIGPMEVQAVYGRLQERGLSARTIRYAHSVLRSALEQAVKWQMLAQNPADRVELPRQRREEMRALTNAEMLRFLEIAEGTRYGLLFELLLATGLRPGEALGLKWVDLDLDSGRLTVQRSLTRARTMEEPKTSQARRSMPLPPILVQRLRAHRARQAWERHLLGETEWSDQGLVFTNEHGGAIEDRRLVRRYFKPLLKQAGLPETVRLYDLRHTHATMLLAAGENPKIVSERLGHASVTLTLDTYSHVLPDMQEGTVNKLQAAMYGKRQ